MIKNNIPYTFESKIWQHNSPGGWFFVSLPTPISNEIRKYLKFQEEGWGRMKVRAEVDNLKWDTAIWFDNKRETYLLPLKANIRKQLKLSVDQQIKTIVYV